MYTSTELFMLTDASDNFADTWAFLDRRLEDVVTLSKYKAEVYLSHVLPLCFVCVWATNVAMDLLDRLTSCSAKR